MLNKATVSKFLQQIQDSINIVTNSNKNDGIDTHLEDDRLSPMTYKKLKELGYSHEDWKNWTQEQANEIVNKGKKTETNEPTKKEEKVESSKLKESKLVVPEAKELYDLIIGDVNNDVTIQQIISHPISKYLKERSDNITFDLANKYNIKDLRLGTSAINTPERKELRQNIANNILNRGSISGKDENGNDVFNGKVDSNFEAEIVIGPPGAGKSTVIVDKVSKNNNAMVIDSDEVKKLLPEYNDGAGTPLIHEESSDILRDMIIPEFGEGGRNQGKNLVIPIVGANPKSAIRYLTLLKKAGYKVKLSFNDVSTLNSVKRSTTRAIKTGRYQSPNYLISVGEGPQRTYDTLKEYNEDGVHFDGFIKYNNNVKFGEPAELQEYVGFNNEDVEKEDWR